MFLGIYIGLKGQLGLGLHTHVTHAIYTLTSMLGHAPMPPSAAIMASAQAIMAVQALQEDAS
jgi:hypothetical protein